MTKRLDDKVDRIESAANITLIIAKGAEKGKQHYVDEDNRGATRDSGFMEIPISRLDTTKEVEISEVRESSLKANGYAITSISYSGTMMFKGSRITKMVPKNGPISDDGTKPKTVDDFLYDKNGVPKPVTININHEKNKEDEVYEHVLVNSESYEVRSEETTETAYDWVAMDRRSDQPDDN
jgi:hypothetical protein